MPIPVNIFTSGNVPTAEDFASFVTQLNTELNSNVTLTDDQSITGIKTFIGSKKLKFKQSASTDKLGFTFYDNSNKEVGNLEYDSDNNFRLLSLGNYYNTSAQGVEGHVGFKVFNGTASAAYRLLCPLAGNAKNSIPTLSNTYTNFYIPLVFTNGAASVTTDNNGKVDLSTLIGSGGDISGLATVATTGDYNDLLNLPTLFSGNYNDLTNKPALFSGDYADLTNKPTIPTNLSDLSDDSTHRLVTDALISTWNSKSDFSGSYNDLTNKPTIPNAQVNSDWNSSSGVSQILNKPNLAAVATTGSYNDLSNKPTIPTVPAISTNITSDATSDTKTASPKAVKDFVEGKGYITQSDIDSVLLSTSEHTVQNRVLYNELRITKSDPSGVVTINSVTNDDGEEVTFITLDANNFATATVGGRQVSIFPSSQYSTGNSFFVRNCLGKVFVFESNNFLSNMDFFIAFDRGADTEFLDGSSNVFSYPSIEWFTWFRSDEVQQITGTQYYYFRDIVVMDWDVDATVPSSIVKSLKQKIEELEARIEQISAQLQS